MHQPVVAQAVGMRHQIVEGFDIFLMLRMASIVDRMTNVADQVADETLDFYEFRGWIVDGFVHGGSWFFIIMLAACHRSLRCSGQ